MLHPNAKQRLKRVVPETFDVGWRHPATDEYIEAEIEPEVRFKEEDFPISYPVVALELIEQGIPRQAFGDEVGEDRYKVPDPSDPEKAYDLYVGSPLYAILSVVVAVDSSHKGIPKNVVADSLAHEVYFQFRHNSDHLNTQGTTADGEYVNYEWPMQIAQESGEGIVNMNDMTDEMAIHRRVMEFRVNYRFWEQREVPATDKAEISLGLDLNYDGEADEWLFEDEEFELYPITDDDGDDDDDDGGFGTTFGYDFGE